MPPLPVGATMAEGKFAVRQAEGAAVAESISTAAAGGDSSTDNDVAVIAVMKSMITTIATTATSKRKCNYCYYTNCQ